MRQGREKGIALHARFLCYYKKNTLALFFCFALTLMLVTAMLVFIHTDHRIDNIEYQTVFSPSDCHIEGLSWQQVLQLKSDPSLEHVSVTSGYEVCQKNGQNVLFCKGDVSYLTMTAKLLHGCFPQGQDEIAAEKWALLNLGVEPSLGQEFLLEQEGGGSRKVKLVGILSDMRANKRYGVLNLYTCLEVEKPEGIVYTAYLRFKSASGYDADITKLVRELGILEKQVKKSPAREDYGELLRIDVQVIGALLLVCLVVFYGIYRIVLLTREKQYGILRAVGMGRGQLLRMVLLELFQIYGMALPVGIAAGMLVSMVLMAVSNDTEHAIYLYQESVRFAPVAPVGQIAACAVIFAVLTGWTGFYTGWKMIKKPVVETISGAPRDGRQRFHFYGITKNAGKMEALFSLGCNYILGNLKICVFVVLTACTGVTLFVGLAYQAQVLRTYREDTKEMWYLNGAYEMGVLGFDSPYQGISRQSAKKLLELPEITRMKTMAGMPIRAVDADGVKRNDAYYEERNEAVKKQYGYELRGYDGTDQIYKSVLYGYNTAALQELKKYVVSGSFDPQHVKEDEVIAVVPSMDRTKKNNGPGWYKDGERMMDYHAGDSLTLKYRADFQTGSLEYEMLQDTGHAYIYKTYTVAAVVSFGYMLDSRYSVYPVFVTSDRQMRQIVPDGCFQRLYIDVDAGQITPAQQEELERKLIRIGCTNNAVSTRSMMDIRRQNEMFYQKQMVLVYGIAAVVFVLVFLNLVNNLRYRMHARTGEICMLRAVGMSVAMIRKMLLFENLTLGTVSVLLAYGCSRPILRYLYQASDMEAFGHVFRYPYHAFFAVSAGALTVYALLSVRVLKEWKARQIMEAVLAE